MAGENEPGAEYSPHPGLYNRFWKAIGELTKPRPAGGGQNGAGSSERNAAAFNKVSKNISTIKEFVSDLDDLLKKISEAGGQTGPLGALISRLKRYLVVLDAAVGMTNDAIQAAVGVQNDLSAWYREAYSQCSTDKTADPYGDQEAVCHAAIARQWQARNVKHVLGTQDGSFVRQVFNKWRDRLKDLILPI
jgi:hypothetical protein